MGFNQNVMHDPGSWVLNLANPLCADPSRVGGKAAQLHALLQADFSVPKAAVLTNSVFASHFPGADPGLEPTAPILADDLKKALEGVFDDLTSDGTEFVVVRSSALSEDGADHSFAGQHATYYYIHQQILEKAVVDCWLSLWSDAATAYRQNLPYQAAGFGMAVIVQQMIQADCSGVCFTVDPTGSRPDQALIEATWGLGAALVDGKVSPDRYWLNGQGDVTERHIGHKRLKVAERLKDPDSTRLEPVPAHQQTQQVLDTSQLASIAGMAREAARIRGGGQDVEWAICDGSLFLLQSRPITALPDEAAPNIQGRWVLFKPIAENLTQPLTPMTVDLFRRVLPPMGKFIHGRYYANADVLARLIPSDLSDEVLTDLLLMRGTVPDLNFNWRKLGTAVGLFIAAYLSFGVSWHRTASLPLARLSDYETRCRQILADDSVDPLEALLRLFLNDHPLRPISEFAFQANISAGRYFLLIGVLKKLLGRWAPDFDQAGISTLVTGGDEMLSTQMVLHIQNLAQTAERDPALKTALLESTGSELNQVVLQLDEQHEFTSELSTFMRLYGHRTVKEVELMSPRWKEDTSTVLNMIRNFFNAQDHQDRRLDAHGLRLATRDELHQACPHRWQRTLIDHLIEQTRHFVTLRENTRHYHTMAFAAVRTKLTEMEQSLIHDGKLRCPDDIFYLEYPEAAGLVAGALDWSDVETLILARRRRYHRQCQNPPPEAFNLKTRPRQPTQGTRSLRGDTACPGQVEGIARVIMDPILGADLQPGEILVAPYTDPAWTPLFPAASAIVVEVGSYLSHAGTLAREFQIPCLVDVSNCTREIRSGQKLLVNATDGWVEILA